MKRERNRLLVAVMVLALPATGCMQQEDDAGGNGSDTASFAAERAYMPYYVASLSLLDMGDGVFDEVFERAVERTNRGIAMRETEPIICLSGDGEILNEAMTGAQCDDVLGAIVQQIAGVGITVPDTPQLTVSARRPQRNKADNELSVAEVDLEAKAKGTGIPDKAWVPDTHDCDDFAWRMFHTLVVDGGTVGAKTYSTIVAGEKLGHALIFIEWADGTRTYLEPQSGEVVELPEPREQHLESTDPEVVNDWFHAQNTHESAGL